MLFTRPIWEQEDDRLAVVKVQSATKIISLNYQLQRKAITLVKIKYSDYKGFIHVMIHYTCYEKAVT